MQRHPKRLAPRPALLFVAALLLAAAVAALPARAQQFEVKEMVLKNGMKVLVHEDHTIPTAAMYIWYRVGSRNEHTNATGLSHFFEHMMFNGAKKYGPGEFDRVMEGAGGSNNAYTSRDVTVYHETFPSSILETIFDLESDRIENLSFDPKIIESERGAVASERRTSLDNNNSAILAEQLWAVSFIAHPYRWDVLGWMVDIQSWTMEDLKNHWKMGYSPSNATLIVTGDVTQAQVFALAEKYMAPIPARPVPPKVVTVEPEQRGERRLVVRKPAQAPQLLIGYHVVRAADPDYWPLMVFSSVLTQGESSRMNVSLVDQKQAALYVSSYFDMAIDPTLFTFEAQPRENISTDALEKAIYAEIERMKSEKVSGRELQKAKNGFLAGNFKRIETLEGKAELLGAYEVYLGDWKKLFDAPAEIENVTAEDVQRVAKKYFSEMNRTVATLIPTPAADASPQNADAHPAPAPAPPPPAEEAAKPWTLKLPPYRKVVLDNGMTLLLMERHGVPLVDFRVFLRTGSLADPAGKEGLAALTAAMCVKGSKNHTAQQFAEAVEFVGGSLALEAGFDFTNGGGEFMAKDVGTGLDLLAEMIQGPTFPAEEFDKLRQQSVQYAITLKDEPGQVMGLYFNAALYGDKSYGRPANGTEKSLANIARQDVADFHKAYYTAPNLVLTAAGDFDAGAMEKAVRERFAGMPNTAAPAVARVETPPVKGRRLVLVDKNDSTQTYFRIGNLGVDQLNPDLPCLTVVNTLFGGRFTSMLNTEIRIKRGLTYGASSAFGKYVQPGPFMIGSFTATPTTQETIDVALQVLGQLHEKGVTAEQLASAKAYIKGQAPLDFETAGELAQAMGQLEMKGQTAEDLEKFFAKMDAATVEDAKRVIAKYYPVDDLVFVLVGRAHDIDAIAAKYAKEVARKKITDAGY